MVQNLIEASISTKELTFSPGGLPASFEVTAINNSEQFATFILEVTAAGADSNNRSNWYKLSPEVSTKQPPGDSTQFLVKIIDTPVPGFVGQMNLTVRIFSIELQAESRQLLRLILQQGTGSTPLKVNLPLKEFQIYPGNQFKVPVQVHNPTQLRTNVVLSCLGLEPAWLIEGIEQHLQMPPGSWTETAFLCQVPSAVQAPSELYPFKIEATHSNGPPAQVEASLQVLPSGTVEFTCTPNRHRIPTKHSSWWSSQETVTYQLQFQNQSNLHQICRVELQGQKHQEYELTPDQIDLTPGETGQIFLVAKAKRPWFGRVKKLLLEVTTTLSDPRLGPTKPASQILKLEVLPIIPTWLAIVGGLLLLFLAWWCSWLNPDSPFLGHRDVVNSVQFNGLARAAISGSNDQTLIEWRVDGFSNPTIDKEIGQVGDAHKAVRVVRYKPVDNNLVAAGLENGEIQLWDLTGTRKLKDSFSDQKDDRVFALEFTQDSRSLFSAHGSGLVLQWDLGARWKKELDNRAGLVRQKQFDFAVYTMNFLGKDDKNLVIGGRYNQLIVWNWLQEKILKVPYPPGSQDDYIFSLDTSEFKPYILVTADNQGFITLWDMQKCMRGKGACEILDKWSTGHGVKSVHSVALSPDACYLASGGDDGRIMLWPLTADTKRAREFLEGKEVARSYDRHKINSVDLKVVKENVLIASGSDDTKVRVNQVRRLPGLACDTTGN